MITLTMDAPGKNALSTELMTWLIERLREAAGEPILLTGKGDAFSAGLNLRELVGLEGAGLDCFLETLEDMVDALFHYPGPTIAWVNGHAIAGGCVVALACDHRLATAKATTRIGLNEVVLGVQFPPKTWRLVMHRLAASARDRVVLEGALYAPETALRLGLIEEIVAGEAEARAYAERIAGSPREAYVATKRALRAGALDVSQEELKRFREEVVPLWAAPELKTRLSAAIKR
jgi:enoyl-CoA hydratase